MKSRILSAVGLTAMALALVSTPEAAKADDCLLDTNDDGDTDTDVDTDLGADSGGADTNLACGSNAVASGTNAVALGQNAQALGTDISALGSGAWAGSLESTAIGAAA